MMQTFIAAYSEVVTVDRAGESGAGEQTGGEGENVVVGAGCPFKQVRASGIEAGGGE
jgi:hypothetical protein